MKLKQNNIFDNKTNIILHAENKNETFSKNNFLD